MSVFFFGVFLTSKEGSNQGTQRVSPTPPRVSGGVATSELRTPNSGFPLFKTDTALVLVNKTSLLRWAVTPFFSHEYFTSVLGCLASLKQSLRFSSSFLASCCSRLSSVSGCFELSMNSILLLPIDWPIEDYWLYNSLKSHHSCNRE